jgi:hypothetical protein
MCDLHIDKYQSIKKVILVIWTRRELHFIKWFKSLAQGYVAQHYIAQQKVKSNVLKTWTRKCCSTNYCTTKSQIKCAQDLKKAMCTIRSIKVNALLNQRIIKARHGDQDKKLNMIYLYLSFAIEYRYAVLSRGMHHNWSRLKSQCSSNPCEMMRDTKASHALSLASDPGKTGGSGFWIRRLRIWVPTARMFENSEAPVLDQETPVFHRTSNG